MVPMVSMILKWEKELEHPNQPFIQHQVYSRLLKAKEGKRLKAKSAKSTQTQQRYDFVELNECQVCNELA